MEFNFEMNNHTWKVIELNTEKIINVYNKLSKEEDTIYVYGYTNYARHEIYINEDMCHDMKRKTLMHELMHCYKEEYVSLELDNIDEETLCNISANSHYIIHKILERYFKNETN